MQLLCFVFGYILCNIYMESKNRPALGYVLNCLERTWFRIETVSFSFFGRNRGGCLGFLSLKGRFLKRIQKILVALRLQTGCVRLAFSQFLL